MSGAVVFNDDFRSFLRALSDAGVEYVVVGGYAMAAHREPRATGDLDIFVRATSDNAPRVIKALADFGAPLGAHAVAETDFAKPGGTYQMGLPPRRVDILTEITGVTFDEACAQRVVLELDGIEVPFIGLEAFKRNKAATGRDKDLVDLRLLEKKKSKP